MHHESNVRRRTGRFGDPRREGMHALEEMREHPSPKQCRERDGMHAGACIIVGTSDADTGLDGGDASLWMIVPEEAGRIGEDAWRRMHADVMRDQG
jgi:hypothetical protein